MDSSAGLLAASAATLFALDLFGAARERRRPHVIAYAVGMASFALASWALFVGVAFGWDPLTYKAFFLFGAVINIPVLALGSVFLVIGPRTGRFFMALVGGFTLWSTLVILPAALRVLPVTGIPRGGDTFVAGAPPILAAIGGGVGATLLMVLALVSAVRFWRTDRRIVAGNALIVAGTASAASGGTLLAVTGRTWGFAVSLAGAAILIWAGYRVAAGRRAPVESPADVRI